MDRGGHAGTGRTVMGRGAGGGDVTDVEIAGGEGVPESKSNRKPSSRKREKDRERQRKTERE